MKLTPDAVRHHRLLSLTFCLSLAGLGATNSQAQEFSLTEPFNASSWAKALNLRVESWVNVGATYNFHEPADGFNGPVTFNDRDRELRLNQFYAYIERPVAITQPAWDIGGRIDLLFGTDAVFTQAHGAPNANWDLRLTHNRYHNLALPQAYLEIFAPFGQGIKMKLGHFYTIIGAEEVMTTHNFFYTHSYTEQYGEPFTHTGVLFDYTLVDAESDDLGGWGVNSKLGAVTGGNTGGWDAGFNHGLGAWRFLGAIAFNSPDNDTTLAIDASSGPTAEQIATNWSLYSINFKQQLNDNLQYSLQFDHGWGAASNAQPSARWMGVINALTLSLQPDLAIGLRAEWFDDSDNFRVFSPARIGGKLPNATTFYAATLGLKWQAKEWLMIRPNLRFDYSDGAAAFDNGQRQQQWLLSLDWTVSL